MAEIPKQLLFQCGLLGGSFDDHAAVAERIQRRGGRKPSQRFLLALCRHLLFSNELLEPFIDRIFGAGELLIGDIVQPHIKAIGGHHLSNPLPHGACAYHANPLFAHCCSPDWCCLASSRSTNF